MVSDPNLLGFLPAINGSLFASATRFASFEACASASITRASSAEVALMVFLRACLAFAMSLGRSLRCNRQRQLKPPCNNTLHGNVFVQLLPA